MTKEQIEVELQKNKDEFNKNKSELEEMIKYCEKSDETPRSSKIFMKLSSDLDELTKVYESK